MSTKLGVTENFVSSLYLLLLLLLLLLIIIIIIIIFIVMLGSIGILAFLGFIRMYTTISHPLDRSFFRIWKEAFETH